MNRWQATTNPQHVLPGAAACAFGTISSVRRDERNRKPGTRRRP